MILPWSGLTSEMMPSNSASGPAVTLTAMPSVNSVNDFGFAPTTPVRWMRLTSSRDSATGLACEPTNPVTPGVLRTTYQLSSSSSICTRM